MVLLAASAAAAAADSVDKSGSAGSDFLRVLKPYLIAGYSHDSNFFKLSEEISPPDGRADQYSTVGAGFDSEFGRSRQKFRFAGNLYQNSYQTYDENDFTGGHADAVWNWTGGKALTGNLGYLYDRKLRSFANQLVPRRDLRTENKIFADADLLFARNWVLGLTGKYSVIDFSATEALNLDRTTGGVSIDYRTRSNNSIGLAGEYINGDYGNSPIRDFNEFFLGPKLEWNFTGKSKLRAKAGYSKRENDDPSRMDYDDFTGRITWILKGAPGNRFTAEIWRELSNLSDEIANFALVQGASVEPRWRITSKLDLRFRLLYEDRDFQGEMGDNPAGLSSRTDKIYSGGIWADWRFVRYLGLSLGFTADSRSSNREFQDYDDRIVQLLLKAGF
jgi:hypothetical protein